MGVQKIHGVCHIFLLLTSVTLSAAPALKVDFNTEGDLSALLYGKAQAQPAHLQQGLLCVIAVFHSHPPLGRGRPRNGSGRCGRGRPPARREAG